MEDKREFSIVYILGVVLVLLVIVEDVEFVYELMIKKNIVVVVSDGLVVFGLGDIGFEVVMLVMEGKVVFFKCFVNVDVVLIVLKINDIEEIIFIVKVILLIFGGINLEDILVLCCFEIE